MGRHLESWSLALALAAAGCAPTGGAPGVELVLYEQPAACDGASGECPDPGAAGVGEPLRARAQLGRTAAALLLRARLRRPSGIRAELQLVLPRPGSATAPQVRYAERRTPGGPPLFEAQEASGRIELSRSARCPCQTGRLELLLRDAGPDGVLRTADDQLRRLSRGRLRRDGRPLCHGAAVLPIREGLLVVGERSCPQRRRGWIGGNSACAWDGAAWISVGWNVDGWYDEDWQGDWEADAAWEEDDGWEGDGWGDDGWGDDGWEDDGWSDDGWEGDGTDDGWEGDTWDDGWEDDGWDGDDTGWWDDGHDDGWSDDGTDDGWWDEGYDDGWSDDSGWSDDGWSDDSGYDDSGWWDDDGGEDDEEDDGWW